MKTLLLAALLVTSYTSFAGGIQTINNESAALGSCLTLEQLHEYNSTVYWNFADAIYKAGGSKGPHPVLYCDQLLKANKELIQSIKNEK